MTYETLLENAEKCNLIVKEKPIHDDGRIYGNRIAIRQDIETNTEKACVLAEELGHYQTSVGNILDLSQVANRKQELRARAYAYDIQIGLRGIVEASQAGCANRYEAADFLGVTEKFLEEALEHYRDKYGKFAKAGNCIICFEPLGVLELKRP